MPIQKLLLAIIIAVLLVTRSLLAPVEPDAAQHSVTNLRAADTLPEITKAPRAHAMKVLPQVVVTAQLDDPSGDPTRRATVVLPEHIGRVIPSVRLSIPYYAFPRTRAE